MEPEPSSQICCGIGIALNEDCHKTTYCRSTGFIDVKDLNENDKKLIEWRIEQKLHDDGKICFHHEKIFLSRYASLQKSCCDPHHSHSRKILKYLKVINESQAEEWRLKPGQKLCSRCLSTMRESSSTSSEDDEMDEIYEPTSYSRSEPDPSLGALEITPVKTVSARDTVGNGYGKRKVRQSKTMARSKLAKVLQANPEDLGSSDDESCMKCKDFDIFLSDLKEKCAEAPRQEKLKLLTMAPASWSIEKIEKWFNVSNRLARDARYLKKKHGILAQPASKRGKPLSDNVKEHVLSFYQNDEFSRVCTGKKDFVTVETTKLEQKQKRLLLCNVKELHIAFQEKTGDKIGYSKFAELRPPWCALK